MSISNGSRKILKTPLDGISMLRNRVQCGLFANPSEELRMRTDLEIFTLHPPEPKIRVLEYAREIRDNERRNKKKKFSSSMKTKENRTQRLVKEYMRKHSEKLDNTSSNANENDENTVEKEEKRYRELLGIPQKPLLSENLTVLGNAYEFALKQLEYQHAYPDVSEKESFRAIEVILSRENREERHKSRAIRDTIVKEVEQKPIIEEEKDDDEEIRDEKLYSTTVPSILSGKPKVVEQMYRWGKRLKWVPYSEWTVGAITALDHWIAVKILELSEDTWEKMLAGDESAGVSRVKDVISVRGALFPETLEDAPYEEEEEPQDESIDQLLKKLGSNENENWDFDDDDDDDDDSKKDDVHRAMVDQLQSWRERNGREPYLTWSMEDQQKFNDWLEEYVTLLTDPQERRYIDIDATRETLLSSKPLYYNQNEMLWSKLSDETEIDILLDSMLKAGPPPPSQNPSEEQNRQEYISFLNSPYQKQRQKLLTLSALREIYDDYTKESDYAKFWEKHKDVLLKDLEVETLQQDPDGHISKKDTSLLKDAPDDARFKLTKQKMLTKQYTERNDVLKAWRYYKTKRAMTEEKMFQKIVKGGRIGLRYPKLIKHESDTDTQQPTDNPKDELTSNVKK